MSKANPLDKWWDTHWTLRQKVLIINNSPDTVKAGYSIMLTMNTTGDEIQDNGDDLRLLYQDSTELDRISANGFDSPVTVIWFALRNNIPPNAEDTTDYYVYYGNSIPTSPLNDPAKVFYFFDDFNDNSFDTTVWKAKPDDGSYAVVETSGVLTVVKPNAENHRGHTYLQTTLPPSRKFLIENRALHHEFKDSYGGEYTTDIYTTSDPEQPGGTGGLYSLSFHQIGNGEYVLLYHDSLATTTHWNGASWVAAGPGDNPRIPGNWDTISFKIEEIQSVGDSFRLMLTKPQMSETTNWVPWDITLNADSGFPNWLVIHSKNQFFNQSHHFDYVLIRDFVLTEPSTGLEQVESFKCGDANGDTLFALSDVIYVVNYIFKPPWPIPAYYKSGDVNADGIITLSDVICMVNCIFNKPSCSICWMGCIP